MGLGLPICLIVVAGLLGLAVYIATEQRTTP